MPITRTMSVVQTLKSLTFNGDGSMTSTFTAAPDDGTPTDIVVQITAEETNGIIDAPLPEGVTSIREGILYNLYVHLVTSGKLQGEITP